MGAEAPCSLVVTRGAAAPGKATAGKALLESTELLFVPRSPDGSGAKGRQRLKIPLAAIRSIAAREGVLEIAWGDDVAAFALGAVAAKWLDKIKNPKSRADKLGIKKGHRVALFGAVADADFHAELEARGAEIGGRGELDALFYWVASRADVTPDRLTALQNRIKKDGAIWVIRPKGSPAISEKDVYASAREAKLVDVKVVAFSATHTAEKMVIPLDRR